MKILVVGALGSMGQRYIACLKFLKQDVVEIDVGGMWPRNIDRCIIATPTNTHYDMCVKAISYRIPFLCEKPLDKDPDKIQDLIERSYKYSVLGHLVCNWRFLDQMGEKKQNQIYYDFYNTGKDGIGWDCIQIIYLDHHWPQIKTDSPLFDVKVNGKTVTLRDIAQSYITMLKAWLDIREGLGFVPGLWDLKEAQEATIKVINYNAREAGDEMHKL